MTVSTKARSARSAIALLGSISMLAFAGVAEAQTAAPDANPAATTSEATTADAPVAAQSEPAAGGLEDIIVTARKRSETAQNIPIALTAYSPAQIQRYDISSVERIAASTPNLQVGRATTGSGAQITLRGIGSPASALGIEQSVAVVVDGAYFGNGRILNEGFFDLARIEVLKGPQALYYGKNATAGVISITTANPGDHFEASTRVGYEFNAQQIYAEQIISGPLTDTLGIRLAVRGSRMFEGYTKNLAGPITFTATDVAVPAAAPQTFTAAAAPVDTPKEKNLVGRVTLQWEPTSNLTNTLKISGNYNKINDPGSNNLIFSCDGGFSTLQPGVPCKRDWVVYHNLMPAGIASTFRNASSDGQLFNRYKSFNITNNLEYKSDNFTLSSNTNYQDQRNQWLSDSDYQSRVTQIYVASKERWRALSEEVRALSTLDGPINGMVGILFQDTRLFADQVVYSGNQFNSQASAENRFVAFSKISATDGRTYSPFGQLTWKIIPQIELSGGVRYTHETKDSTFVHPYVRPGQIYVLTPVVSNQTFTNFSPEVTLSYKPTSNINIYGGYKTGYKSGGFSNESSLTRFSLPSDLDFEPEEAKGFEGGVKTTLMENQLRFDVAAYSYKITNLQVDFFEAQTFRFVTTNAGSARTKGIELTTEFAPRAVPGLSLHGALNYNKAYYISFVAPCVTGQKPSQGCNTASPFGGLFGQNLSGKPTANAPRWTAAFGGSYETNVSGDLTFGLASDLRYSSSYNGSAFNNPIATQGKYANLDASIFLRSAGGWDISLIGRNLTNKFVISGALDAPSTGSGTGTAAGRLADQRGYANTPRTVQLQLTYRY